MRAKLAQLVVMVLASAAVAVPAFAYSGAASAPFPDALRQQAAPAVFKPAAMPRALLQRDSARPVARFVTVRAGQSLSGIAASVYGKAADWPVLYWANRARIRWASQITAGLRLTVPALPAVIPAAPRQVAPPVPPAPRTAPVSQPPVTAAPPVTGSGDAAHSALGDCIRNAEEGGSYAWGPGNGGGAYQFQVGTWETYGGAASEYGVAGPAYQDQIFDNAIAAGGASNWTLYDGC